MTDIYGWKSERQLNEVPEMGKGIKSRIATVPILAKTTLFT